MLERGGLEVFIRGHKGRRPAMRAADAYKLLYQGVFGVGHILGVGAWDRLVEEAGRIDIRDHPEEPLYEDVFPDGSMVRVNLRTYLRGGLPLESLFEAMRASAKEEGSPEEFLSLWEAFAELVYAGRLPFDPEEVAELESGLNRESPQPKHHTRPYREAYHPAYRVVKRSFLEQFLGNNT